MFKCLVNVHLVTTGYSEEEINENLRSANALQSLPPCHHYDANSWRKSSTIGEASLGLRQDFQVTAEKNANTASNTTFPPNSNLIWTKRITYNSLYSSLIEEGLHHTFLMDIVQRRSELDCTVIFSPWTKFDVLTRSPNLISVLAGKQKTWNSVNPPMANFIIAEKEDDRNPSDINHL